MRVWISGSSMVRTKNCPRSSGMGRLFDGVYALLTGRETVTYEGQGAILLEAMAESADFTLPTCFYGGPMGTSAPTG